MAQSLRKTALAATIIASFATFSPAAEPPQQNPVEIIRVSTNERSDEDAKAYALAGCLIVLGGLGAYAVIRNRLRSRDITGDRNEDDCWK